MSREEIAIKVPRKADYSHWIGKRLIRKEEGQIPQEGCVLESSLPSPYRVMEPGSFGTCDFRPERMNVEIDQNSIITRVSFG